MNVLNFKIDGLTFSLKEDVARKLCDYLNEEFTNEEVEEVVVACDIDEVEDDSETFSEEYADPTEWPGLGKQ